MTQDAEKTPRPTLATLADHVGTGIWTSGWIEIDQAMVDEFGRATLWDTWMHCDPERCARESPYGGTLLHGFHAVALVTRFLRESGFEPVDGAYSLNCGTDKVRLLQPVVIGEGVRLRDHIRLLAVQPRRGARYRVKTSHEIECEGMDGAIAYVEYVALWHPSAA